MPSLSLRDVTDDGARGAQCSQYLEECRITDYRPLIRCPGPFSRINLILLSIYLHVCNQYVGVHISPFPTIA